MTITWTEAQLRKFQGGNEPTEAEPPKPKPKRKQRATERAQDGRGVESGYTTPKVSAEVILGMFGGQAHSWRYCPGWSQWIARCGIGKHGRPTMGVGEACGGCSEPPTPHRATGE